MFRRATTTLATTALAGLVGLALAPASAAADGTSIEATGGALTVLGEAVGFTGTCAAPASAGVLTLSQNGQVLSSTSVNAAGVFAGSLTATNGRSGLASLELSCLTYAGGTPVSSAVTPLYFTTGEQVEIPVELSGSTGKIGEMLGVKATCPEGSTRWSLAAGGLESASPFFTSSGAFGASTYLELPLPLVQTGEGTVEPQPGPAAVVVLCEGAGGESTAVGLAGLTVTGNVPIAPTPLPIVPTVVNTDGPAAAPDADALLIGSGALALGAIAGGVALRRRTARTATTRGH